MLKLSSFEEDMQPDNMLLPGLRQEHIFWEKGEKLLIHLYLQVYTLLNSITAPVYTKLILIFK